MDRSRIPPRALEGIVVFLVPAAFREEVVGDLRERFAAIAATRGRRAATRWYRHQVLALRPWALRRQATRTGTHDSRAAGWSGQWRGGDMLGGSWMLDARQALRGLRSRPAVSLTVVLTVALAVGAATAVFSVVDGVLLRPLPFPDSGRLVRLWQTKASWMDSPRPQLRGLATHYPFSPATFDDLQSWNHSFSAVGAFSGMSLTFRDADGSEVIRGHKVTSGVFRTLGVDPVLGRYLTPADDRPGAAPVIVLSHGLWRDRFGSDPHILGRDLHLGAGTRTVVGVMPAGFSLPDSPGAFWTSLPEDAKTAARSEAGYSVLGRLRPGVTLSQAAAEANGIASRLATAYPDAQGSLGMRVESLLDSVVGDVRATLLLLLGTVGLVLVIACVNVANVLSVLGLTRRRELAVKAALGAAASQLARSQLGESLLLAGLGGAAGVALSVLTLPLLTSILPPGLPRRDAVSMNLGVLAFGLGVTLLTAFLVALIPALQAGRVHPARTLKESGRSLVGGRAAALRSSFVVAEVALAFALLVAAGLLGNSFEKLWHVKRGFDTAGLAEVVIVPDPAHYPARADRNRFNAELRTRIAAIPGVEASATNQVPLSGSISSTRYLVDRPSTAPDTASGILRSAVLDNYFAVMRIPLVEGRGFSPADGADAPPVTVVNEAMAREYWPGQSALGKRIRHGNGKDTEPWMTVVGVAGNVQHLGLSDPVAPKVYLPASQSDLLLDSWVVRSGGDLGSMLASVRAAVARVSPTTAVQRTQVMQDRIASSVAVPRFRAYLVIGLAAMAALLALVGVYGVTSFTVSQHTRDIGVRIALGSEPGAVVRRIMASSFRLTAIGLAVGLVVAIPASRLVTSFLFQVELTDPATWVATVVLVWLVGSLAAYMPARRAASVDPVRVLNEE